MRHRFTASFLVLSAALILRAPAAIAAPDPVSTTGVEEARRLYAEGHAHYLAGRCGDAMPLLLAASRLVPSPNSGLLIARCLLAAGRRVEAATLYEEVEHDALELVHGGEKRYADTAAAALKEGAALRSKLGLLRVKLPPDARVSVEIDGVAAEPASDGAIKRFHEPGTVRVAFVTATERKERTLELIQNREAAISYEGGPSLPPPPPPPPPPSLTPTPTDRSPRIPTWAIAASGGVSLTGLSLFTGFGLASESTYGNLESRCAPNCAVRDQADADRGRTFQTVANVGLVLGLVFAAATGVFFALR